MSEISFPNETAEYRRARNALLEAEISLRAEIERAAWFADRRSVERGLCVR